MRGLNLLCIGLVAACAIGIPQSGMSQVPRTQFESDSQPDHSWSNSAATVPGWRSQYPLSAQTTGRLSFSSAFPLGANVTSGLTSNGANLRAAEGEIFKLDARSKRLWIRTPEEKELFFYYTGETPVLGIGSAAGVEGLDPGARKLLRVLYTQDAAIPKAVHIEVMKTEARAEPSRRPLR